VLYNVSEDLGDFVYAVPFYESPILEHGSHRLEVTVDHQFSPDNSSYILNFLTIGTQDDREAHLVIVDDNDTTIEYSGNWSTENSSQYQYKDTIHESNMPGSAALFTFSGTSIEVYGSIRDSSNSSIPLISFQVDNMEDMEYFSINDEGRPFPRVQFYSSGSLSPGVHTLRVESLAPPGFGLDYFVYQSSGLYNQSTSDLSRPKNTASIAWGTVGGFIGLTMILLSLFLIYRHRKKSFITFKTEKSSGFSKYFSYSTSKAIARTNSLSGSTCFGTDSGLHFHENK
jgi:hypothetical protein